VKNIFSLSVLWEEAWNIRAIVIVVIIFSGGKIKDI
jgi:hypothetical protein